MYCFASCSLKIPPSLYLPRSLVLLHTAFSFLNLATSHKLHITIRTTTIVTIATIATKKKSIAPSDFHGREFPSLSRKNAFENCLCSFFSSKKQATRSNVAARTRSVFCHAYLLPCTFVFALTRGYPPPGPRGRRLASTSFSALFSSPINQSPCLDGASTMTSIRTSRFGRDRPLLEHTRSDTSTRGWLHHWSTSFLAQPRGKRLSTVCDVLWTNRSRTARQHPNPGRVLSNNVFVHSSSVF